MNQLAWDVTYIGLPWWMVHVVSSFVDLSVRSLMFHVLGVGNRDVVAEVSVPR